jgi:hypothetical protein
MPPKRALKNDWTGPWETTCSWTRIVVAWPSAGLAPPSVVADVFEGALLGPTPPDPGALDDWDAAEALALALADEEAAGVSEDPVADGSGVTCGALVPGARGTWVGAGVAAGF